MSEVKSAHRVMQILNLLRHYPLGLTISETSALLDLPKSSTHELLHSMANENYLRQDGNRYSLGLKVFEIGQAAARSSELIQYARPALKRIGEQLSEAVQLGVLDGTEVVYLSKMQFRREIQIPSQVGDRLPAHATGLGKAMLSKIPKKEVVARFSDVSFERFTPNTISSLGGLERELELTRVNGYAVDRQEYSKSVFCYAMPIMDSQQQLLGAISVSLPREPENKMQTARILDLLTEATTNLSQKFRPSGSKIATRRG